MNGREVYLGLGCVSDHPLPEVANDVAETGTALGSIGFHIATYADTITPINKIEAMIAVAEGADNAVFHYSGHGMFFNGEFALYLGNMDHICPYPMFISKIIRPLCSMVGQVTLFLDTCFAGAAQAMEKTVDFVHIIKKPEAKTIGTDWNMLPKHEVADHPSNKIDNLAIVTAASRRQPADGQWVPMSRGGWASFGTYGKSLFSNSLVEQIYLANNLEYVAKFNADYHKIQGDARKLRQIENGISRQTAGMYEHFGSTLYQQLPPRVTEPIVQVRIGRKHDGILFHGEPVAGAKS
jgi:hypothetical protein